MPCSHLIHRARSFITEENQAGKAQFSHGKTMPVVSNHFKPEHGFQFCSSWESPSPFLMLSMTFAFLQKLEVVLVVTTFKIMRTARNNIKQLCQKC